MTASKCVCRPVLLVPVARNLCTEEEIILKEVQMDATCRVSTGITFASDGNSSDIIFETLLPVLVLLNATGNSIRYKTIKK